ncbi:hypothetical protein EZV62_003032 [Acer yangbiense]|uniref:Uncharacterized protein n=1 Tax=Acer yangbiense TaxID=1000413 RepID=A0A5C7IZ09_9ROSI|nr:hypothetical protein EZV62_003032 [Acer yangbiense]
MNPVTSETTTVRHVVAMPYPGRSHINSMMNLCRLMISKTDDKLILITFVVTEEWLLLMRSESKLDNIYFASIPNVIPSEVGQAADINGFFEAYPVLGSWCGESEAYSGGILLADVSYHVFDISTLGPFKMGNEHVDYIPGVSPTRLMDFPLLINGSDPHILRRFCDIVSWVSKAQYLLFSSNIEPLML